MSAAEAKKGTESDLARKRRTRAIDKELMLAHPDAHCELDYTNPLELAVATILSAQCTDERVNKTTPALFAAYKSAEDYAQANPEDVEMLIRSTGFFRNKTRSIIGLGQGLMSRFDGVMPQRMEDLITLPGIGRKTANVILGNAFGVPGIPVDTHMLRLCRRLGISDNTDPVKVEFDLHELLPPAQWIMFSHRVIWHGRRVCNARKPACGACTLARFCPSFGEGPVDPVEAAKQVKGERRRELLALVGIEEDH